MLKLIDYRSKSKGLPDLLPYAALVEPGVILNKDGSFTAAWEVRGQDTASATESDLSLVSSRFNNAVKLLGSGWMLHMDAIRSSHKAYPAPEKGHFPDPVTRLIDEERREHFSGNRCFSTSSILTATYKPNFQAAKLAGKAQAGVATSDALGKALLYFQNMLEELEDALSAILYMDRLLEYDVQNEDSEDWLQSDLLSHLQHCTSGELQLMRVPKTPMYLDALLGSENLVGGIMPRLGEQYLTVLSLDGLPQESYPAMLRDLDALAWSIVSPAASFVSISMTRPRRSTHTAKAGGNRFIAFLISFSTTPTPVPTAMRCSWPKTRKPRSRKCKVATSALAT